MSNQTSDSLKVRIEYDKSIELKALGNIFCALSREYSLFSKNLSEEHKNTTLSIKKIRECCIEVELIITIHIALYPLVPAFFEHLNKAFESLSKCMKTIANIVKNAKKHEEYISITIYGDNNEIKINCDTINKLEQKNSNDRGKRK